ncbi:MAG: DUF4105 domain-containing protein [Pseudomonas sp.]
MSKRARSLRWLVLALAFVAAPARAQEPGSELTVYLLTMGVGDFIYERFGHNAILIRDAANGTDLAYNWGMFDSDQPGFLGTFLKGRMMYWMQPIPLDRTLEAYQSLNRSVWAQELNLTPAQKKSVQTFVEWNARDENKFYRYDYYRDNCSTRVRDVLDLALAGNLKTQMQQPAGTTYRSETTRLMLTDLPILAGMNLAMGPLIDEPLTHWTQSFIPMRLQESLRTMKVRGASGQLEPLVRTEYTLFQADRQEPPATAPNLLPWYLMAGLLIAAVFVLLGTRSWQWTRVVFGLLAASWSLAIGLLGVLLAGLWAFTDHAVTFNNENVLQANVFSLVLFVALIGMALNLRKARSLAVWSSVIIAGLAVLGLVVQVLPGLDQANAGIIALLLPTHVALAWVILTRHRKPHLPAPIS